MFSYSIVQGSWVAPVIAWDRSWWLVDYSPCSGEPPALPQPFRPM